MRYRFGMGLVMALVVSLLIGLTVAGAVGGELEQPQVGVLSGNPTVLLKEKPADIFDLNTLIDSSSEPPSLPTFFLLSVGLMVVTTTAIVTSKELFPSPT